MTSGNPLCCLSLSALHASVSLFLPTREQALEQRLDELRAIVRSILATRDTLMATLDNCPNKQHLPESAEKTRMLVRKVSEQVEAMVGSVKRSGPLDDILSKLKHFQEQCQNALDFVNGLTGE